MKFSRGEDKLRYLRNYASEIIPITKEKGIMQEIADKNKKIKDLKIDPKKVEKILKDAETELFYWENSNACHESKRFFLTMNDPGAFSAIKPLLDNLLCNEKCKSILVMAGGIAKNLFNVNYHHFGRLAEDGVPLLYDLINAVKDKPIDIIFTSISVTNGPEKVALFAGRSILGARKMFFVCDNWCGIEKAFSQNMKQMEYLDGIFCNDEFSKEVIRKGLPSFPRNNIYSTGNGAG